MTDDLDDLLGPDPDEAPKKRSRGRPKGSADSKPRKPREASQAVNDNGRAVSVGGKADASVIQALHRPVSITFMAEALRIDRKTVARKLADLPPVDHHRGQMPLYNFQQAIQYLVKPKVNVAEYVRKMGVSELPLSLQKDVWDAKLKEQKWREQAGELWRTEDVMEVLGETFQRLKTTTQLWIDQIAEGQALPPAARTELTKLVDGLQTDLHKTLVKMPQDRQTPAMESEVSPDEDFSDG